MIGAVETSFRLNVERWLYITINDDILTDGYIIRNGKKGMRKLNISIRILSNIYVNNMIIMWYLDFFLYITIANGDWLHVLHDLV